MKLVKRYNKLLNENIEATKKAKTLEIDGGEWLATKNAFITLKGP